MTHDVQRVRSGFAAFAFIFIGQSEIERN